jgi:hypothetical protein
VQTADILRQLARTFLLCGALGGALFLVVMALSEWPPTPFVLTIAIGLFMIGLAASTTRFALRTGVFPVRLGSVERDREPVRFRFYLVGEALFALSGAGLAAYATLRLITG